MPLQPAAVLFPDVRTIVPAYLRTALTGRSEPYAQDVEVGATKPDTNTGRFVTVRRDGGVSREVFDYPRVGVRVWADTEDDAVDLALLIKYLLQIAPGHGQIAGVASIGGPSGIPDDSQYQQYLTAELMLRGIDL